MSPTDHDAAAGPPEPDQVGTARRSPLRWLVWFGVAAVALGVLVFGAILIYANFINDPQDALTAADLDAAVTGTAAPTNDPAGEEPAIGERSTDPVATTTVEPRTTEPDGTVPGPRTDGPGSADDVSGTWQATPDSQLGYRVVEVLFGVNTEGVGRTNQITGALVLDDTTVTEAQFEVDMASVQSDDGRRDGQFRGRIMTVAEYPTSTFVLTEPIELGRIPDPGEQIEATATGDLTLRGVTNQVTFDVTAQVQNGRMGVLGNIPIVFADYQIANPSISGISTEDHGLLEFVLVFERDG